MSTEPDAAGPRPKGFPLAAGAETGWSIFDDGVPYPVAVMFDSGSNTTAGR